MDSFKDYERVNTLIVLQMHDVGVKLLNGIKSMFVSMDFSRSDSCEEEGGVMSP